MKRRRRRSTSKDDLEILSDGEDEESDNSEEDLIQLNNALDSDEVEMADIFVEGAIDQTITIKALPSSVSPTVFTKYYKLKVNTTDINVTFTNDSVTIRSFIKASMFEVVGMDSEKGQHNPSKTDMDSPPRFYTPPDLLQFCFNSTTILMIHVTESLFQPIHELVDRIKYFTGMNIVGDLTSLEKGYGLAISAKSLELSKAGRWLLIDFILEAGKSTEKQGRILHNEYGIDLYDLNRFSSHDSLNNLAKVVLNVSLPKPQKRGRRRSISRPFKVTEYIRDDSLDSETSSVSSVDSYRYRRTDWANENLDYLQIAYAALDAWASYECWKRLEEIYIDFTTHHVKGKKYAGITFKDWIMSKQE